MVGLDEIDSIRPVTMKPFRPEKDSLIIEMQPRSNAYLHFLDTLRLKSNLPIAEVNNEFIQIFDIDTVNVPFTSRIDPNKDAVYLEFETVPNDFYRLQILPNALVDFLGATNDTLFKNVRTQAVEKYGTLNLRLNERMRISLIFLNY